jgi:epsilon-lactone hydrolase
MPSFRALAMRFFVRNAIRPWLLSGDLEAQRRHFARLRDPRARVRARVEKIQIDGRPAEWLTPEGADEERVLYYIHGGAFIACSPSTHRESVARIARAAGMRALLIDYRLAPEHPFPAALEDSVAGYRFLLASGVRPENIVIGGDSAGGALTLGTLLKLRAAGEAMPRAAVCLSPVTDATWSGDSWKTRLDDEALLSVPFCRKALEMYLQDHDRSDPLASPLFADLHGLPPIALHVGTHEFLLDDSVRLAKRAQEQGVFASLRVWDGMWHVFHMFDVPEAHACVREIAAFIRDRFDDQPARSLESARVAAQ